jgi:PH (Pleckstrin Homology) domain-containing protein
MAVLPRLLAPGERVHAVTREHGVVLVPAFARAVLGIAGAAALALAAGRSHGLGPGRLVGALAAAALAAWMLGRLVRAVTAWHTRRLVITDRRALLVQGGLTRRVAVVPLASIDAIEVRSSGPGRLLRYGGLVVTTHDRRALLHGLRRLPDPDLLFGLVLGLDERIPAGPARRAAAPSSQPASALLR